MLEVTHPVLVTQDVRDISAYTAEQLKLAEEIPAKEAAVQGLRDMVGFIAKAKRHTDIIALPLELPRPLIRNVAVREKSIKWSKKAMQTIEIHYSGIGYIGGEDPQDKESPRQEISA